MATSSIPEMEMVILIKKVCDWSEAESGMQIKCKVKRIGGTCHNFIYLKIFIVSFVSDHITFSQIECATDSNDEMVLE